MSDCNEHMHEHVSTNLGYRYCPDCGMQLLADCESSLVRMDEVLRIVSEHPEYPEPCPMLHEVAAKAAAEMNKEWIMHMVREACRQTKKSIISDLSQSLPNDNPMRVATGMNLKCHHCGNQLVLDHELNDIDGTIPYLEGALAKAKTWSQHSSPYLHHTEDCKEWMRGYTEYSQKRDQNCNLYETECKDHAFTRKTLDWIIAERDRMQKALEYIAHSGISGRHMEDVARNALSLPNEEQTKQKPDTEK